MAETKAVEKVSKVDRLRVCAENREDRTCSCIACGKKRKMRC